MNYKLLNEMINYIEDNLIEKIDYKILGKIVGVNDFILQRVFVFLTGITLPEYIKKRRLSKSYEELVTTNNLIVDIAFKYNYNSSSSFSRAFKREYNITPKECRIIKEKVMLFPKLNFDSIKEYKNINYEIVDLDEIVLYCFVISAKRRDDFQYKIRELYNKLKKDGIHKKMNEIGMYAISSKDNDTRNYCLGSSINFPDTTKKIIPKGKYIKFDVKSRNQVDIINIKNKIYNDWIPSTNYKVNKLFDIEYYEDDTCYRYVPIK